MPATLQNCHVSVVKMQHVIDIQRQVDAEDLPDEAGLVRWVTGALQDQTQACELTVRLVDAEEMRALNLAYRGKDYATNVLSFPADLPEEIVAQMPERLLGDLVLCLPVLRREAAEQGKTLAEHMAHLLVHGCLHLQGYDHEDDAQAAEMEQKEIHILALEGISNPYEQEAGRPELP